MMTLVLAMLSGAVAASDTCPAFSLDELQPELGEVFVYDTWLDGVRQPARLKFEVRQSEPGQIRADLSVLAAGEWTPGFPRRLIAGLVMHDEAKFGSSTEQNVRIAPVDSETLSRDLFEGDEIRIAVAETAIQPSGETVRHSGDYVIRHAGCGHLLHEGTLVQTRQISVRSFQFRRRPGEPWQLGEGTWVYDIPVGATFWYSQSREGVSPMEQGTLREGYTVP